MTDLQKDKNEQQKDGDPIGDKEHLLQMASSLEMETFQSSAVSAFQLSSGLGCSDRVTGRIHLDHHIIPKTLETHTEARVAPLTTGDGEDATVEQPGKQQSQDLAATPAAHRAVDAESLSAKIPPKTEPSWASIRVDLYELILLLILYTVQGIPMGLSASVPFLLQGSVTYKELGIFSLVSLPFSCKVFWAPIVDSVYFASVGRRKSWLIPVQLVSALIMYFGGSPEGVDRWMGSALTLSHPSMQGQEPPNVHRLLIYFGVLYFLMATQDIAVDGWSLTMLSDSNRHLGSVCNAVGQTLGFSIAHVGFLTLSNPESCNRWFRSVPQPYGLVTLGSFLRIWSYIVFATTVVACWFSEYNDDFVPIPLTTVSSKEVETGTTSNDPRILTRETLSPPDGLEGVVYAPAGVDPNQELCLGVKDTYKLLGTMLTVWPVVILSAILLTCRFAFAAVDAAAHLKLIEAGMTKEELVVFGPVLLPVGLICPIIIGRWTSGERPLRWFVRGWLFRVLMSFVWLAVLRLTRGIYAGVGLPGKDGVPLGFYLLLGSVSALHTASADIMFSSQMAFFSRISDPAIGGTYMTFLNTIANMGNKWPGTIALMTLDYCDWLTWKNGFVFQTLLFSVLGLLWLLWTLPYIRRLESEPREHWMVIKRKAC